MNKYIKKTLFFFDYYLGYFMYTKGGDRDKWRDFMIKTYPEMYENEVKYLKEKNKI